MSDKSNSPPKDATLVTTDPDDSKIFKRPYPVLKQKMKSCQKAVESQQSKSAKSPYSKEVNAFISLPRKEMMKTVLQLLKKLITVRENELTEEQKTRIVNTAFRAASHLSPDKQTQIVANLIQGTKLELWWKNKV